MIWLYRLLFLPAFLAMFPYYALRMIRRGGYAKDFSQRLGFTPKLPPKAAGKKRIWLQAVSVGEVEAVMPLVKKLNATDRYEVAITTTTSTAYALLNGKYAADCFWKSVFPIDFWPFSAATWRAINPDLIVLMEGEVWPEHLHQAAARGVPAILVNARLSDRSFGRYSKVAAVAKRMFAPFAEICVSNETDMERFAKLGVPAQKMTLTGNIKFDTPSVGVSAEEKLSLKRELGFAPDSFVLLGSSTWSGEEKMLVGALEKIRAAGIDCRLLLVPRHAERRAEVKRDISALPHCVRTEQKTAAAGNLVYLADTTGELRMWTAISDLAFVGKSLFGHNGGQSPIDAAAAGVPIVYGDNMTNFKLVCKKLEAAGAARKVFSPEEAIDALAELAMSPEKRAKMSESGKRWHAENEGATRKTLEIIGKF